MSPAPPARPSSKPDPIALSLFANRFMSVAEAMGRSLQQTAISTNIKERLDYSCALFAPDGDLVANAPFIPVHLGSMSFAVKYQLKLHGSILAPGDVVLTNSPSAGGSHLPDITVITPVFAPSSNPSDAPKIIFFTASRGHQVDVGGILPGSMPPTSTTLSDEGACIESFFVVRKGVFNGEELRRLLVDVPAEAAGSSGCRSFSDVQSDLKAQISANHKGAQLIGKLIQDFSLPVVQEYMGHIRENAELGVRALLRKTAKELGCVLEAKDFMDDGSPIQLKVTINPDEGSAVFDFAGTGPEIRGCWNAPTSVCHAAIIYCLRAMCAVDMPLNGGCLAPIRVEIPAGCLLAPSKEAAVCGGNVITSQRITDVVLRAFNAAAASQGCCNNLTFGAGGKNAKTGEIEAGWGYYETIAGGSGAGPTWHGTSGVHVHMTNTRITDPEILERRYPVLLHQFSIRKGSGGKGEFNGGDGVIREMEFSEPLQVSILSERRVHAPFGLHGGQPASCGLNLWIKAPTEENPTPRTVNIGGKSTVKMGAGDRLVLHTPGGGGWGAPSKEEQVEREQHPAKTVGWGARGSLVDYSDRQAGF